MGYKYRCKNRIDGVQCDTRRTLPKLHTDYVKPPRCTCGGLLTYLDVAQKKYAKANTCFCNGVPYPHQAKSSVWCIEHPTGPTDEDYEQRYR